MAARVAGHLQPDHLETRRGVPDLGVVGRV
jgi:hypothetical protein